MKIVSVPAIVFSAALVALCGCASYRASPLNTLSSEMMHSSSSDETVLISAKMFNSADCKKYLDRDVIREGYQPVQLYIANNSSRSYHFSLNRVGLPCARPEEVAEKVHTSTAGRSAGYGAAALILWPMAIPAVVDGVKSSQANDALDSDFAAKTATDRVLPQYSNFNKLIFVPVNEFQPDFDVTLIDLKSDKKKTLNVHAR